MTAEACCKIQILINIVTSYNTVLVESVIFVVPSPGTFNLKTDFINSINSFDNEP